MITEKPVSKSVRESIRPTTLIEAPRLEARLGVRFLLASETFQWTGSFKFRAACNVAMNVPEPRVITASSGNFGQAMARACRIAGKACCVVMPKTSAQVKIDAVREFGGTVDLIDTRVKSRRERVNELAKADPEAYVASPYNDPLVIQGNATLGEELGSLTRPLDWVIAPVGGGGLTSGLIQGLRNVRSPIRVMGAEPFIANDAARSLRAGRLIANETEPQTIADGARTISLGQNNWEILREGLAGIVEVSEEQIKAAVGLAFSLANLKAEPTGALSIAALIAKPELFRGQAVCCVVSGGNVDPAVFCDLLKSE